MKEFSRASGPTRRTRAGLHPLALAALLGLACLAAGCTTLVDDPAPLPSPSPTASGPSFIPETQVFPVTPSPQEPGLGNKRPTHAELIEQGKSPLPGALPGSEKVLMHVHGKGEARIVLPAQRSGALLWILAGCEIEAPLTIRTLNLYGVVVARYDLEPCRAAEGGGGTEDGTSTLVEIWTSPDVEYDLSIISSEIRAHTDGPRR
ncbi:hypothetical protein GCM10009715_15810 [Paeniglutamicibacter psychrophenolicus]|uniref:Lipoprotein n=1 Tax=Paeniglutamicibacter psychrophenolicus TaxID=257454 RepID=A0ABS4WE26_9MICC|nr:hypothetical protein [Paeniglutamicibacter psychrophenolicus]MBP2373824.1 hypothetical protein [Paeniglutamicibacter psychrophenolicus]